MRRLVPLFLLCCSLPAGGAKGQEPPDATVRLTVSPAKQPSPALKYPLLPELRDLAPGNAALLYYRSFSPEWLTHRQPKERAKLDVWRQDTKQKPDKELRWVLRYHPLDEVARGARRVHCDWEMNERVRKEGIAMLLPDVQSMRDFGFLLALRARFEIEAGEHDKVLHTLQTAFALSRHVAEAPTLIQVLVGLAIHAIAMQELEHWIESPGAPNLYWSLTNLPSPYTDLRKPLQGERLFLDAMFPGLREGMAERRSPAVTPQAMMNVFRVLGEMNMVQFQDDLSSLPMRAALALYAAKVYPDAKMTLREQGWKEKDIAAMPVTQAAVIHEVLNYDRMYDEMIKWAGLPYWQAREGLARANKQLRAAGSDEALGMTLARLLLPAMDKVMFAAVRADRRIAALRCIEALRMHAAATGGWPEKLAGVTEVPIPPDPVTGKPFDYRAEDRKAFLSAPPPAGERPGPHNTLKYEITLKK